LWSYRELYSCPLPLILGVFEYGGLTGYVVMPILNLRVNLLTTRSGEVRVYSNIPHDTWRKHTLRLCTSIASNQISTLSTIDQARAYSMFYGGISSYIAYKNTLIPVALDFINTEKYYFYLEAYSTTPQEAEKSGRLEDWIILHTALRCGEFSLLLSACRNLSHCSIGYEACTIKTDLGILIITRERFNFNKYLRIVPDNAPLRHVVVVD
jgi:hypothetical protein